MFEALVFAINITLPNLLLLVLGFAMQKNGFVNDGFVETASKLVFNYCLPCLLFFSVLKSEVNYQEQVSLLGAGFVCTFLLFFMAELYAKYFVKEIKDKGVFVQGVFRSNMAIMSLAIVANAYGDKGIGIGAIYMGIMTIIYNILSVITLSRTQNMQGNFIQKTNKMLLSISKNPLIIALVSAFFLKAIGIHKTPEWIGKTGSLLGAVALPLALICAGASLNIKSMLALSGVSMQASIGRIIIAPLLAIAMGMLFNLTPVQFGVLFFMVASPAAAASYVMAKAMGGNDILAANILGFTTIFSMLGLAIGSAILRSLAMI